MLAEEEKRELGKKEKGGEVKRGNDAYPSSWHPRISSYVVLLLQSLTKLALTVVVKDSSTALARQ